MFFTPSFLPLLNNVRLLCRHRIIVGNITRKQEKELKTKKKTNYTQNRSENAVRRVRNDCRAVRFRARPRRRGPKTVNAAGRLCPGAPEQDVVLCVTPASCWKIDRESRTRRAQHRVQRDVTDRRHSPCVYASACACVYRPTTRYARFKKSFSKSILPIVRARPLTIIHQRRRARDSGEICCCYYYK